MCVCVADLICFFLNQSLGSVFCCVCIYVAVHLDYSWFKKENVFFSSKGLEICILLCVCVAFLGGCCPL